MQRPLPEREKYKENLDQQIESKKKALRDIEERIIGLKNLEFNLDTLRRDVLRISQQAESIKIVSQDVRPVSCQAEDNEIQKQKRKKCIS